MNHIGTQTIETARLILRRFTVDDAEAMFNNWASDDEVTKYMTWPTHPEVSVTRQILTAWAEEYAREDHYRWAIVLKANGPEPIGSIDAFHHDDNVGKTEVGYCIGRKWWHQDVTSEALAAVIAFMFHQVGMQRVEARHDPRNVHSGRVMEKCGMVYEGTHRRADRNNQGLCDASWYAILKEDTP